MAASRVLQVVIVGDSASAQRAFEKTGTAALAAAKEADKASTSFERSGAKVSALGGKVESVGKKLSTHVTLPLVAVGAAAVKMSLDFQKSMLLVETHTETSAKMVDRYRKAVLAMSASGKYTQGPKELADAMYHIASDGYKGERALKALRESANLAMLGQSELAETTYAVVSAMKTGIKGTQDLHETIGILNGTMGAGDTKMDELTAALSTGVVPAARAVGLELKDVGAALAFLTARGIPAQKAAYGLAMNFQMIVPHTKNAKEAFEAMGMSFEELGKLAEKGPEGWLHALEDLKQHLAQFGKFEQTQMLEEIFGGGRTSRGVLAQIQNLNDLKATYERLGVIASRTDKNLKTARESEANVWKEEWAKLQAAMVELGSALTPIVIPVLKEVAGIVTGIAKSFNSLPDAMKSWIVKAGIAVAALGPLLTIGGSLLKVYGSIAGAIGRIGRGLGIIEAEQVAGSAVGAVGGGVAGTAGATAAGSSAARWLGTDAAPAVGGAAVGAYGEKAALEASGIFGSGRLAAAMKGGAGVLGGVIGGYFAAEFGAKAIEGITGADLLENQSLAKSLTHGFNTSAVKATEKMALAQNAALEKARETGVHPRLELPKAKEELKGLERSFEVTMKSLASDTAGGMKVINADLKEGIVNASQIWSTGTKPWRQHTTQAMEAAVGAIRKGMQDGSINVKRGQREIDGLLERIHILKGDDPFGLAEATSKSFKQAGQITESGVQKWSQSLAQMPVAARKSTIDSTNEILQAWAQGHPKIEGQITSLTAFEVTHFGATNQQLREGVKKDATGPIAEAFNEAAAGVGGALQNIGTNTTAMLKALGLHDVVEFQALVLGPSRLGATTGPRGGETKHHEAPGSYHGKGRQGRAAGGKVTRPTIYEVGEEAPLHHEWVIAANPAYREANLGYWAQAGRDLGVPGFAQGGSATVRGPGKLAEIGHAALSKAIGAANAFLGHHIPSSSGGAGYMPGGGGPVVAQIGRILLAHGLNKIGAAGIIGNALQESGWNPGSVGSGGGGLWGFTASPNSLADLQAFAKASRKPWTDVGLQTQFLVNHVPGSVIRALNAQSSAGAAAAYFMNSWERPYAPTENLPRREAGARIAFKMGYAAGGKVGSTGTASTSSSGLGDATHVLGWARHHLGNGDKWGYPGEWCGAFVGADMLAHGIQPPSGYPAAAAWAAWGEPRSQADAGDIVVYGGSGHVGISLGGGKLISGNYDNKVAISDIRGSGYPGPIVAIRRPPYTGTSGSTRSGSAGSSQPKYKAGHTSAAGGTYGSPSGAPPAPGSTPEYPSTIKIPGLGHGFVPKVLQGIGMRNIENIFRQAPAGLSLEAKYGLAERAQELAEETGNNPYDDRAVYHYEIGVAKKRKEQIQGLLKKVNAELKRPQTTKEQHRLLARRRSLEEELTTQNQRIGSAREGIAATNEGAGLEGGEGEEETAAQAAQREAIEANTKALEEQKAAEEEHTAALKEVSKSLEDQTKLGESIMATSASTYLKVIADMNASAIGARTNHAAQLAGNGSLGTV